MIHFKPEVQIRIWNTVLTDVILQASLWSLRSGVNVEVNSIDDGQHGVNSLHGSSLAVDLDTDGDKPADLENLYQHLRRAMSSAYDVIHEGDHVHVEWDVKRKESRVGSS